MSYAASRRCGEVSSGASFRKLGFFFQSASRVLVSQPRRRMEMGGDKRLIELELAGEADGIAPPPDPV